MDEQFRKLLISACDRPGMYVGRCSLWGLSHYLEGYCHAASDANSPCKFNGRFQLWAEYRFGICDPAWHWVRILLHEYGADEPAIAKLPDLYNEFQQQTNSMTDDELFRIMENRLVEMRGDKFWCPNDANTWTKPTSKQ